MYNGYHFLGMHLIWWCVWIFFIFVIFGMFIPVPRSRFRQDSALDILQKRFAAGAITTEEYQEKKKIWKMIQKNQTIINKS